MLREAFSEIQRVFVDTGRAARFPLSGGMHELVLEVSECDDEVALVISAGNRQLHTATLRLDSRGALTVCDHRSCFGTLVSCKLRETATSTHSLTAADVGMCLIQLMNDIADWWVVEGVTLLESSRCEPIRLEADGPTREEEHHWKRTHVFTVDHIRDLRRYVRGLECIVGQLRAKSPSRFASAVYVSIQRVPSDHAIALVLHECTAEEKPQSSTAQSFQVLLRSDEIDVDSKGRPCKERLLRYMSSDQSRCSCTCELQTPVRVLF